MNCIIKSLEAYDGDNNRLYQTEDYIKRQIQKNQKRNCNIAKIEAKKRELKNKSKYYKWKRVKFNEY